MNSLKYIEKYNEVIDAEIYALASKIHEFKGQQNLYIEANKEALNDLLEIAKIQSTEASNEIEGIITTEDRIKKLVTMKTMPKTRSEEEIAGYRDVLNAIHESFDYIPITPGTILQFHRDLYKFNSANTGGEYKAADNEISEVLPDGTKRTRFKPVASYLVESAVVDICQNYNDAMNEENIDSLIVMPMFILDFLCVHPFRDGNGRMSRLLTLLLLYQSGFIVGKYISIEKLIADHKDEYYDALQASSVDWHENKNTYKPFVKYMLRIIIAAYRDFSTRVELIMNPELSKPDRVAKIIEGTLGEISKSEVMKLCPDISQTTVQRALSSLLKEGKIIKTKAGKYTRYI